MTTTATRSASSSKTVLNGVSRQVKTLKKRAASEGRQLKAEVLRDGHALTRRASQLFASATRSTRNHPWTAAATVLAGAAALIGGYMWANRR